MAKKGSRNMLGLVCEVCGKLNYISERNKVNSTEALRLNKHCNKCKKHTKHKEKKKLD